MGGERLESEDRKREREDERVRRDRKEDERERGRDRGHDQDRQRERSRDGRDMGRNNEVGRGKERDREKEKEKEKDEKVRDVKKIEERERGRERDRNRERNKDRDIERDRDRDRDKDKDRERDKDKDKDISTHTGRDESKEGSHSKEGQREHRHRHHSKSRKHGHRHRHRHHRTKEEGEGAGKEKEGEGGEREGEGESSDGQGHSDNEGRNEGEEIVVVKNEGVVSRADKQKEDGAKVDGMVDSMHVKTVSIDRKEEKGKLSDETGKGMDIDKEEGRNEEQSKVANEPHVTTQRDRERERERESQHMVNTKENNVTMKDKDSEHATEGEMEDGEINGGEGEGGDMRKGKDNKDLAKDRRMSVDREREGKGDREREKEREGSIGKGFSGRAYDGDRDRDRDRDVRDKRDIGQDRGRATDRDKERVRERERDRERDRDRDRDRNRERERSRDRSRDRGRDREVGRGRARSPYDNRQRVDIRDKDTGRERDSSRSRDIERERDRDRERERERERERSRDLDRNRDHGREGIRGRDRDRDRERERERERERRRDSQSREKGDGEREEENDEEYSARVAAQMDLMEEDEDAVIERQRKERQNRLARLAAPSSGMSSTTSIPVSLADFATPTRPPPTQNHPPTSSPKPTNLVPGKGLAAADVPNHVEEEVQADKKGVQHTTQGDMFAEEAEGFGHLPLTTTRLRALLDEGTQLTDNWDDAEGYYRARSGEMLADRYKVFGSSGQGVFSTVIRAYDTKERDQEVAIKIIRNNEHMEKAGLKEMECLSRLNTSDPDNRHHCVRMLNSFTHRNHLCIVFEGLQMNLRELLRKYGQGVGLSIPAVRTYAHQLLMALRLLYKANLIHADIKPDNILVNQNKTILKLADLGSAIAISEADVTPLLVSRYYRAPEVILGVPYGTPLDLWSVACSLYELYTGSILFAGKTNNDMLRLHMQLKGKISRKLYLKAALKSEHFDDEFNFLYEDTDKVTGKIVVRKQPVIAQTETIAQLVSGRSTEQYREWEGHFADLLDKMLVLDPTKRITITQALQHPFITYKFK